MSQDNIIENIAYEVEKKYGKQILMKGRGMEGKREMGMTMRMRMKEEMILEWVRSKRRGDFSKLYYNFCINADYV